MGLFMKHCCRTLGSPLGEGLKPHGCHPDIVPLRVDVSLFYQSPVHSVFWYKFGMSS